MDWSQGSMKFVFVMDNASIQKTKLIKETILNKVSTVYTAPYSLELNSIEEVFSKWENTYQEGVLKISRGAYTNSSED